MCLAAMMVLGGARSLSERRPDLPFVLAGVLVEIVWLVYMVVGDASLGFIAVAISTLIGSMPTGWLGARYGRRRMSLVGLAGMTLACVLLHFVPTLRDAIVVLFLFGLSWSIPVANLPPMALELASVDRVGASAGAFLLIQSLAGVVGPALVGEWFEVTSSRRALFALLAAFSWARSRCWRRSRPDSERHASRPEIE